MKSILLLVLSACLLLSSGCKKTPSDCGSASGGNYTLHLPPCISAKIEEIKSEPKRNPPAKVYSYRYNGIKVYYVTSYCCDAPAVLYDENCRVICYPDGGFAGGGDEHCTDFLNARKCEVLVWKDNR